VPPDKRIQSGATDGERRRTLAEGIVTQGKQYAKPPIDEAVVEFLFDASLEWDGTVPGKLQAALADDYPGKAKTQALFSLSPGPPGGGAPFLPQSMLRTLLPNDDGTRLIGVAPNLLTIHELSPYRGWDEFSRRAARALDACWKVSSTMGVRRIRVRYVNRIVIPSPGTSIPLDDYFTAAPRLPGGGGPLQNFITRVERPYDDGSVVVMTFAPAPKGSIEPSCAFVLDFDLLRYFDVPTDAATTLAALEILRTRERAAFEAMITDATRSLFV
jgi:uncharacterized protein (TIGR04255 family)